MKRDGFMKMCSLLCLVGLLAVTGAVGLSPAAAQEGPLQPFTLRAKLSVNNVTLTASDALYTIAVTDTSLNPLVDTTTGSTTYGGVVAGRFEYEIPMTAATTPANACITVSYNGTPLTMTYPAKGACPAGSGEITGLISGDAVGFGGIDGQPNNSTYTLASAIKVTSTNATAATISVQCNNILKNNGTTPEAFGSVDLGQTKTDTTCEIGNTGVTTLNITALTVSNSSSCGGFSVVSPAPTSAAPISLMTGQYTPITLAFAPCVNGAQTGTLTISSNATTSVSATSTVALAGTGVAVVPLASGWNLISLPAVPSSTDPYTLLTASGLSPILVCGWSGGLSGVWSCYPTQTGIQTLTTMTIGNGYWIEMNASGTLTIH
jgi:hypothetical protein